MPIHPLAHIRYPIHRTRRLVTDARPSDGVELEDWSSPRGGAGSSTNSPMGSLTDDGLGDTPRASEREPTDEHVSIRDADAGDEARRDAALPLSGINDDGYFGDASGQWLNLEPNASITLHASADADPWLEVKDFARVYGAPFVSGILTVVVAVSALIWWSESRLAAGERAAEAAAASDSGPGRRLLAGALGEAMSRGAGPGLRAARKLLVVGR